MDKLYRIKPLEWVVSEDGTDWRSDCVFGHVAIGVCSSGKWLFASSCFGLPKIYDSFQEAQSRCEEIYRARMLEGLVEEK